jgi:hypothetical protein
VPPITFLDESGTHDGSRVVTVAGFMLPSENVPELEQEWRSELDRRGVVELHMREFVPPHGSYSGWTAEAKRALFGSLIDIIHRHTRCAVGAAVEIDEFFKNIYRVQMDRYPQLVHSPYSWCMRYCIAQVADRCRNNDVAGPVDYVMDQGNSRRSEAQKEYADAKKDPDLAAQFCLGNLDFADSTTTVGLQCADLLAYEMYKEADRRLSGAARRPRGSFAALLRDNDRLMTIDPNSLQRKAFQPVAMTFAIVEHLPPKERFQVLCYAIRSITDEQRRALFQAVPAWREVYETCVACGEMGKRLDELPPEVLPPDNPELLMPTVRSLLGGDDKDEK